MEGDKVKLNIKMMNNTLAIEVDKKATVLNMKQTIKEQTQANEDEQKLIYKGLLSWRYHNIGKILKDDDTLETHHIQNGDSLHLVVKKKQQAGIVCLQACSPCSEARGKADNNNNSPSSYTTNRNARNVWDAWYGNARYGNAWNGNAWNAWNADARSE